MFTGIIERTAVVRRWEKLPQGARLVLDGAGDDIRRGESVAVNGVCLTALHDSPASFAADLSPETLQRTALGDLKENTLVNIERALALGGRLNGHIVQGHVDDVGRLESIRAEGDFAVFRWSYPAASRDLVVPKGSITVDGISLTIVDPDHESFAVALIPETLERTNLAMSVPGQRVNLEFDIMAKLVRHMLTPYLAVVRS